MLLLNDDGIASSLYSAALYLIQNISSIYNGMNIIIDPKEIADHLNEHFCNIAKTIEAEIPPSKKKF